LYAELIWGGLLATVTVALQRQRSLRLGVLALFAAAGLVLPFGKHSDPHVLPANTSLAIGHGVIRAESYRVPHPDHAVSRHRGAVTNFRDGFFLVGQRRRRAVPW